MNVHGIWTPAASSLPLPQLRLTKNLFWESVAKKMGVHSPLSSQSKLTCLTEKGKQVLFFIPSNSKLKRLNSWWPRGQGPSSSIQPLTIGWRLYHKCKEMAADGNSNSQEQMTRIRNGKWKGKYNKLHKYGIALLFSFISPNPVSLFIWVLLKVSCSKEELTRFWHVPAPKWILEEVKLWRAEL